MISKMSLEETGGSAESWLSASSCHSDEEGYCFLEKAVLFEPCHALTLRQNCLRQLGGKERQNMA